MFAKERMKIKHARYTLSIRVSGECAAKLSDLQIMLGLPDPVTLLEHIILQAWKVEKESRGESIG